MALNQLAQTHARAICGIAREKNLLGEVGDELKAVADTVRENNELTNLFYHPLVPAAAKKDAVKAIFAGDLHDFVENFILLLIDKRREAALPAIVQEYTSLANELRNIVEAEVTVAKELTKKQLTALTAKLEQMTGKKVAVKIKIDASILGGVIVQIGDKLIDGSTVRQLQTLKSNLLTAKMTAG